MILEVMINSLDETTKVTPVIDKDSIFKLGGPLKTLPTKLDSMIIE
jgi:hypothetical protein